MPKKQGVGETNWNKKEKKIPWEGSPIGERPGLRGEGGTEKGSVYQPEAKGLEKRTPDKPIPAAHAKVDVQPAYAPEKRDSVGEVSLPYAAGLQAKREIPIPEPSGTGTKSPPALGENKPFAPYMAGRDEGTATGIPYAAGVQTGLGSAGPAAVPKETKTQSWSRRKPPSRSSEDILEELMTLERYYDDLGQEADTWVLPAAIRETGDVPLEAATIKPYLDVLQKEWEDAKNWEWEEWKAREGYRDATLWDLTVGSFQREYDTAQYGKESFWEMMGDENNKKEEYEEKLAGEKYKFIPRDWLGEAISGGAGILGQWARQIADPETFGYGLTAAGAALIAGNAGPQAALPEEAITVPGAYIAGVGFGAAKNNFEIEAGLAYNELIENGVSQDTARTIAMCVGAGNAALEFLQLDELLKSAKVLKRSGVGQGILQEIGNELIKRGAHVGNEVLQEVGQEAVTIGGVQAGTRLETGEWAYDAGEVTDRLVDTAKSSALAFGGLTAAGTAVNTAGQTFSISDQTAREILMDWRQLEYLERKGNLKLSKDMLQSEKLAAIKEAVENIVHKEKTTSEGKAGKYRAVKPQNVELPTVPIINLSMKDIATINGGKLPKYGNYLRRTIIDRAVARLGLDTAPKGAVYIEASNVKRNGDAYVLRITKESLGKMLSASSYPGKVVPLESLIIIENLEQIVNNGVYYDNAGDRDGRPQIAGYDYLQTTVYIDNQPYIVNMRVRVYDEKAGVGGNRLYHLTPEVVFVSKK